jgi:YD repeat-containing protein
VAYTYDELGRLKTVSLQKRNGIDLLNFEVSTNTYTLVGNLSTVSRPNGVVTTYLYDSLNRLTNLTHNLGGTNLLAATVTSFIQPAGARTLSKSSRRKIQARPGSPTRSRGLTTECTGLRMRC